MKLVDLSVERPVMMTMLIMAAVVLGLFSLQDLAVDLLPEVEFPMLTIRTIYPGAGPKEIETTVTKKIEDAISSVSGIKTVLSTSMEGVSVVFVEFEIGTNIDVAATDVKDKIDMIKINLPEDAKDPTILKLDLNAQPVITLAVSGRRPLEDVYKIVDDVIVDELGRVDGVASVDVLGAKEREILVSVDQQRLDAYNLSIMQIIQAVAGANLELPGGRIKERRNEYTVRLVGEYADLRDIANLEIPMPAGQPTLRLKDVAEVIDTFKEQRELVRLDGRAGVGLSIVKKADANVVKVAHRIKDRLAYLKSQVPDDIDMKVMIDKSIFIEASIRDLVYNMLLGALLTGILLYLFLHSFRGVIIAGVSIPTSIIATFNLIKFAGFSINFMSLMALAISVGILVTNAIVVLENIHIHLENDLSAEQASKVGTTEVAIAVLASTLTNIVVFTPIAFMKGLIGQFFLQFGLTVTFATIFSLLTAFTLTPMLSALLLKKAEYRESALQRFAQRFEGFYSSLAQSYRSGVAYALRHRLLTVITITVIFFGTFIGLGKYLGFGFFQEADQGLFNIQIKMPPGSNLQQTNLALERIEAILQRHRDKIVKVYTVAGKTTGSALRGSNEGVNIGEITVDIGDKEHRDYTVKEFYESLRKELALGVPAASIVLQEITPGGGGDAPIQLQITGDDLDKLVELANQSEQILKASPQLVDISSSWEAGKPEIQIIPHREIIASYGLSVARIAMAIRAAIDGQVATQYRVGSDEYDIRVRFNDQFKNNLQNIRKISFLTPRGKVPITELCDLRQGTGPTQINRKNKKRLITLTAGISYGAIGNIVAGLKAKLDKLPWPKGYGYYFAGQEERRQESQGEIGRALLIAIILTYMLLAAILESFVTPVFIMMTVPLALIGVIFALVLTANPLDIFSMMAIVMLVGIVVNNAILILDYVRILREQGMALFEAMLTACETRLRPIIMANTAVVLGMLPLALGIGKGAEMRAPMAIVSIGGIISSSLFTLFLIPLLYYSYENWREKRKEKHS